MIVFIPIRTGKLPLPVVLDAIEVQTVPCRWELCETEPDPINRRIGEFRGREEIIKRCRYLPDEFVATLDSDSVLTGPNAIAEVMPMFADPALGYVALRRGGWGLHNPHLTLACAVFRTGVMAGIKTPIPLKGTCCCCECFTKETERQGYKAVYSGDVKLVRNLSHVELNTLQKEQ